MEKLQGFIDAGQAQLCLDTLVTDLMFDDNGDVVGVKVDDVEIPAPSTIIATGGSTEETILRTIEAGATHHLYAADVRGALPRADGQVPRGLIRPPRGPKRAEKYSAKNKFYLGE